MHSFHSKLYTVVTFTMNINTWILIHRYTDSTQYKAGVLLTSPTAPHYVSQLSAVGGITAHKASYC